MADDWVAFERLLDAAHAFADRHEIRVSKEELERLRQGIASALGAMDDEPKGDQKLSFPPPSSAL
jgi:hypothetical protein